MSSSTFLGKNIAYDYQKKDDKHVFGGYLNLAFNNVTKALTLFKERFKLQNVKWRDIINEGFRDNIAYSDWELRVVYLQQYLPLVRSLNKPPNDKIYDSFSEKEREGKRRSQFREKFIDLIKLIENLRHFYTHYHHDSLSVDNNAFDLLDDIFLGVCKEVRKKRKTADKTKQLLNSKLKEEYKKLIENKKLALSKLRKAGKPTPDQLHNAVFNDAFKHLLFKDKATSEINLSQYYKAKRNDNHPTGDNDIPFSVKGLVFLMCLFLTKKQGEDLRSRIKGFKGKTGEEEKLNSLRNMATHWVYSYLACKESRPKITTAFESETLLAQIVDELSKVPDEVYQTLSQDDKTEFLEDVNEYVKDGNETESLEKSTIIHPVIRKRYGNRFNYLAIRFLDEFADFPNLLFQVHLGNYVHDRRTKNIEGTNYETDRVVREQVYVFGKLSEVAKIKNDHWLNNQPEGTKWQRYPDPSYRLVGNNIPIYLRPSDEAVAGSYAILETGIKRIRDMRNNLQERKKRGQQKSSKRDMVDQVDNKKISILTEPTALLSLNEIPAILYQFLIEKRNGTEIEKVLVTKLMEHVKAVQSYEPDQQLPQSKISKKLKQAGNLDKPDINKVLNKIKNDLEDIANREREINEKQKEAKLKKRFRVFRNTEVGTIASWIASDMIRFIPTKERAQWKGFHHAQLQYSLAFFETRQKEAQSLLESLWKMDEGVYWGQKFKRLFSEKSFVHFYVNYLWVKREILQNFENQIHQFGEDATARKLVLKELAMILPQREFTIHNLHKQKTALLAQPLVFPRGIFDLKPTFIKGKKPESSPELFADWYIYAQGMDHDRQKFYKVDRDFRDLMEREKLNDPDFILNKRNITAEEQLALLKMKQNIRIKRVVIQDVFLKDIANYMLDRLFDESPVLTLKDFYLTQDDRRREVVKAEKQSQRSPGDRMENIHKESFIWGKVFPFKSAQLQEAKVKLKDIGKYKRYAEDEKVKILFSYDPVRIWTRQELMDELELKSGSYEVVRREQLLQEVQELEKYILGKVVNQSLLEHNGNPNFRLYVLNGLLSSKVSLKDLNNLLEKDIETLSVADLEHMPVICLKSVLLILIRNKFAHNQLPRLEWFLRMQQVCQFDLSIDKTYSLYFLRIFRKIALELRNDNPD
jgi:predicted transcriptional regulator YdeE